jgi:hypothetical protein
MVTFMPPNSISFAQNLGQSDKLWENLSPKYDMVRHRWGLISCCSNWRLWCWLTVFCWEVGVFWQCLNVLYKEKYGKIVDAEWGDY